jgi:hypothetical protein
VTNSIDLGEHSLAPAWLTRRHWPVVVSHLASVPGNLVGPASTAGSVDLGIAYCES